MVSAMSNYEDCAYVQIYACRALGNLASFDEFDKVLLIAGCRRAVVDALDNHTDHSNADVKELHKHANNALTNFDAKVKARTSAA